MGAVKKPNLVSVADYLAGERTAAVCEGVEFVPKTEEGS